MPHRNVHGILNFNKPEGCTSFGVISWLRRLSAERRIGYAGTLDPFASGVLPVLFGQATKISRFLSSNDKAYEAIVELGISTDTFDRAGKVVARKNTDGLTPDHVTTALYSLRGCIEQVPPVYSAIKLKGKKYYQLARKGVHVTPKPRKVNIKKLEIIQLELPRLMLNIECSSGTYIRSLAHDLGQILGCGAYLKNLVRTKSGVFQLDDARAMPVVEAAFRDNSWRDLLYPMDYALRDWSSVVLDAKNLKLLKDGNSIRLEETFPVDSLIRGYNAEGLLVALLKYNPSSSLWQHDILLSY